MRTAVIEVSGIVQGVGFRPFVYNKAKELGIRGYVQNRGTKVRIVAQGERVEEFIKEIARGTPLSKINDLRVSFEEMEEFDDFEIKKSEFDVSDGFIPADVAICDECIKDILGNTRFHGYWATSCVNCGPRFTIIESIPYDRERTSMRDFPMCEECRRDYENPANRRFHAQTIACEKCGPKLKLFDAEKREIEGDPIKRTAELLKDGYFVAIKGIGGFHIASVLDRAEELRRRLRRPRQPFAIMATLEMAERIAEISEEERKWLLSPVRPIVILRKKNRFDFPEVSHLHTLGIMLPYTGLHYLLFQNLDEPLIMTSANEPGEPMVKSEEEAFERLKHICHFYLIHNRRIVNRCDDSVVKLNGVSPVYVRMSRGLAPAKIEVKWKKDIEIIGLGAELNGSVCIYKKGSCYISQYLGHVRNYDVMKYLEETAEFMMGVTQINPDVIAHDMHPAFLTTRFAKELAEKFQARRIEVQHHVAHVASLLAEGCDEIVALASDGVGYAPDGIWGGEVFVNFNRYGGLRKVRMPGGDLATRYPSRMVAGILYDVLDEDELRGILRNLYFPGGEREIEVVLRQMERDVNVPRTSSTGRVLDAASALLGICHERTYEGEPAMSLEAYALYGDPDALRITAEVRNGTVDTAGILLEAYEAMREGARKEDIALAVHRALADGFSELLLEASEKSGIENIGMTGGVAANSIIPKLIKERVEKEGKRFILNRLVPPGDGGISFGQCIYAVIQHED
ncbi:MAG: hydrogenase maturation protein HypF [Archaeoglobi archaeon]|nr:hydrogenase maturation protein HypF [Archaeoglobi archaeon]